jgi:hypothetical protein
MDLSLHRGQMGPQCPHLAVTSLPAASPAIRRSSRSIKPPPFFSGLIPTPKKTRSKSSTQQQELLQSLKDAAILKNLKQEAINKWKLSEEEIQAIDNFCQTKRSNKPRFQ